MKSHHTLCLIAISAVTILSCSSRGQAPKAMIEEQDTGRLNIDYQISPGISNKAFDLKQDNYSTVLSYKDGVDTKNCECFFSNGLLEVNFKSHFAQTVMQFKLSIDSTAFYSTYFQSGHLRVNHYSAFPVEQNLILSTDKFQIGKPVYGIISFKGISFTHLMRDFTHFPVDIRGEFGCIPKKEIYSGY